MNKFYTFTGLVIQVSPRIAKLCTLEKAPDDAKIQLMQHANAIRDIRTNQVTTLENDFDAIAFTINHL